MNVIVFASRKGGSGKSTLTAQIAAQAHKSSRPCLLIDADPQGSLTLWHGLRDTGEPALRSGLRGVSDILKSAKKDYDWVFIDTPPTVSSAVTDAIRAATLVIIPTRPTVFDLTAVRETIELCRGARKFDPNSPAAAEIARLWTAITKSIQAIEGAYSGAAMHKAAA